MTMESEPCNYSLCLFPVQQVIPGRGKWEQIVDEAGQRGELTLVDPGAESGFTGGYAFVPHPALMDMTKGLPGIRQDLYIKKYSRRAKEKNQVILFSAAELGEFREALKEFVEKVPSTTAEVVRRVMNQVNAAEPFEVICWNTMLVLYDDNPFRYWRMLVEQGFVPYMIEQKQWQGWEEYKGRERDYISRGGYTGTQAIYYSFYGTDKSREEDGIREVGRYLKEKMGNRTNESSVRKFLSGINPLECGRYVCGVKISDRTAVNNGGYGGGYGYKLLYDKEAVYQGMKEKAERSCMI